jgi:hypothetical protein
MAQAAPATSPPVAPPAAAEAPDSAAEPMEEPQTGDHWTYEVRDDITGEVKSTITNTVTDVSGTDINVRLTLLGNGNPGYLNFDRSWNLTNSGIWRYTPNDGTGDSGPADRGQELVIQRNRFEQYGWSELEAHRHIESDRAGKHHNQSGHLRHVQDRNIHPGPERE